MKTIQSLLIGLLFLSISLILFYTSINSLIYTTYQFNQLGSTTVYSFEFTFFVMAIIQAVLAIGAMVFSVKFFQLTSRYYIQMQKAKRDKRIHNQLEEEEYEILYDTLRATNIHPKKVTIIEEFFEKRRILEAKDYLSNMFQASRQYKSQ